MNLDDLGVLGDWHEYQGENGELVRNLFAVLSLGYGGIYLYKNHDFWMQCSDSCYKMTHEVRKYNDFHLYGYRHSRV